MMVQPEYRYHSGFTCTHREEGEPNPCEDFDRIRTTVRYSWQMPCQHCERCFWNRFAMLWLKVFSLVALTSAALVLVILASRGLFKLWPMFSG